jgi:hypothetical protein
VAKKKTEQFNQADDDLLAELGVEIESESNGGVGAREERIVAGFEEIQRFVTEHGRLPQSDSHRDIFERLYAVRLAQLRTLAESASLLAELDHQKLLSATELNDSMDDMSDDELLSELGIEADTGNVSELRHVRSQAEIRAAADEIAERQRCENFDEFEPKFIRVEAELRSGLRETRPFERDASIEQGQFFILGGQMVFVAEIGTAFRTPNGAADARMRVIFANGTESNLLLRSLQRALHKDDAGRRLTESNPGPLFSDVWEPEDKSTGTIYVLRSLSKLPYIAQHRGIIHKIGVTSGRIEDRIRNAANESTYLFADVEVVVTYKLSGINRSKLEALLHRVFAKARLDVDIDDGFGRVVKPEEWFLLPLHVIDEAVERIRDGSLANVIYDTGQARFL